MVDGYGSGERRRGEAAAVPADEGLPEGRRHPRVVPPLQHVAPQ